MSTSTKFYLLFFFCSDKLVGLGSEASGHLGAPIFASGIGWQVSTPEGPLVAFPSCLSNLEQSTG